MPASDPGQPQRAARIATFNELTSPATFEITSIDSPARRNLFGMARLIVALEPAFIIGALLFLGVPWLVVACVLGGGLVIVAGVFWLIGVLLWKPMQRRYPAQPILDGAVSQSWQSFAFGRFARTHNCLTIIADEKHVHLQNLAPLHWVGYGRISLPLDRIVDAKTRLFPRGQKTARLDGRLSSGPEWCLRLASTESTS